MPLAGNNTNDKMLNVFKIDDSLIQIIAQLLNIRRKN